jgi:hypothetical protein
MLHTYTNTAKGTEMLRYHDELDYADNYDEEEMTDEERRAARDDRDADRYFARMDE